MALLAWFLWLALACSCVRCDPIQKFNSSNNSANNLIESNSNLASREKRGTYDLDEILEELKDKRDYAKPGRMRFSSWAGKRSYDMDESDEKLSSWDGFNDEDKRAKFNSWGGKRAKFNSWGGKRGDEDNKRAKFNSWGGKRSEDEKRAKFHSWGGKRDYDEDEDDYKEEKRAKFSSWGGKRGDAELAELIKRAKFNSWGGKRSINETDNDLVLIKRASYPVLSWKRKPVFSSWGGKRTARSTQHRMIPRNLLREHNWGSLLRPIRRGPDFYAWGGKRSV